MCKCSTVSPSCMAIHAASQHVIVQGRLCMCVQGHFVGKVMMTSMLVLSLEDSMHVSLHSRRVLPPATCGRRERGREKARQVRGRNEVTREGGVREEGG